MKGVAARSVEAQRSHAERVSGNETTVQRVLEIRRESIEPDDGVDNLGQLDLSVDDLKKFE